MRIQTFPFILYECTTAPVYSELQVRVGGIAIEISIKRIFKINKKGMAVISVDDQIKFYSKIFRKTIFYFWNISTIA